MRLPREVLCCLSIMAAACKVSFHSSANSDGGGQKEKEVVSERTTCQAFGSYIRLCRVVLLQPSYIGCSTRGTRTTSRPIQ